MGGSQPKPEFVTVLADKHVRVGQTIVLRCETNVKDLKASWEKNGHKLECVDDKHKVVQFGTTYKLEIKNAVEADEGNYTLTLHHPLGSESCSAMIIVELNEWRRLQWKQEPMINVLKSIKISDDKVTDLRFLLCGPVGAGKSSLINTIKTIFNNRQAWDCLAAAASGKSFTKKFQKVSIGQGPFGLFPYTFYDVMGLEAEQAKGVHNDDVIKALKGHIVDGYRFEEELSITDDDRYYIRNPDLNKKIHCLVNVVPANSISLIDENVIQKMTNIRKAVSLLGIPQMVLMTKVDMACQLSKEDLSKVYQSKKIKEKMHECSNRLGVPLNCIFPVKSYHDETQLNEKLNCLMLEALTQMVHSASDYVERASNKQKHTE